MTIVAMLLTKIPYWPLNSSHICLIRPFYSFPHDTAMHTMSSILIRAVWQILFLSFVFNHVAVWIYVRRQKWSREYNWKSILKQPTRHVFHFFLGCTQMIMTWKLFSYYCSPKGEVWSAVDFPHKGTIRRKFGVFLQLDWASFLAHTGCRCFWTK